MVHDIDVVVIPKYITREKDLFGTTEQISRLDALGLEGGDRIKKGEIDHIPFDLYIASAETWATLLLIRTGSKQHNIHLTTTAQRLGYILRADGTGVVDVVTNERLAWESEEDIFRILGVPFLPPEGREIPARTSPPPGMI